MNSTVRRLDRGMHEHHLAERSAMDAMHGPSGMDRPRLYLDRTIAFQRRAKQWIEETDSLSSVSERLEHPACQQILTMGPVIIPLVLAALAKSPWRWVPVMMQITGQQPVDEGDFGNADAVRAAWKRWGEERRGENR